MISTSVQPVMAFVDETNLWMPPQRLWRHLRAKGIGGLLLAAIFVCWLVIQWSDPMMRILTLVLLSVTAWVVFGSIAEDCLWSRGGQISLEDRCLVITRPDHDLTSVPLDEIAYAKWRQDERATAGLWFFDKQDRVLAHLDTDFLGDEQEARAFLRWVRQRVELPFRVGWPDGPQGTG